MKDYRDLLKPAFLIGYTTLLAIIGGMFVFQSNENIVTPILTVLTNVLTGAVTYFYTKEQIENSNKNDKTEQ